MNREFWVGKNVFITGHTGFKGSWLSLWLQDCGANLTGFSLDPNTEPNIFTCASVADGMKSIIGDIRNLEYLTSAMVDSSPDIVIHMAAQPLVRFSYENPHDTYSTNVMGTVNIFEAIRKTPSVKAVVNVTTDKCYENKEWVWGYREDEAMGGYDPYSSSKGCSELVTTAYRNSFFHNEHSAQIASARAGNVIGGGDWSKDRLVPDILKSLEKNEKVLIRNPNAIRPWQHVLEPLDGYLLLAEKLYIEGNIYAESWNFGPEDEDVKEVKIIIDYLTETWSPNACWEHDNSNHPHEAQMLKLDISKAKKLLHWSPKLRLFDALDNTRDWHKKWIKGDDPKLITLDQIRAFERITEK
ncbi:MAG: CDP-glucose 4,6-dehydratase [Gammaproteobacteria bacterium]